MRKNAKVLWAVVGLLALGALPCSAAAQVGGNGPAAKAEQFIQDHAKSSLEVFIQVGCTFNEAVTRQVPGPNGSFTISVRYHCSGPFGGKEYTDIHYGFDANGHVSNLKVGKTTFKNFPPFSVANGVLGALRDALDRELDNADAATQRIFRPLVRSANAQTIHRITLRLQQPR